MRKDATDSAFLAESVRAAVAGVTVSGFSIIIDEPNPIDLEYNWIAIAIDRPKRTIGVGAGESGSVSGASYEASPAPTPTGAAPTIFPTFTPVPTPTSSASLTPTPTPVANIGANTITVLANDVGHIQLLDSPQFDANEIGQIPTGTVTLFTEERNGWYNITYQELVGWVSGALVSANQ